MTVQRTCVPGQARPTMASMGREKCDCIVPAAGRAQRMGRWKPVVPFDGRTIIETVVSTALRACSRVVLVTGYRGAELAALRHTEHSQSIRTGKRAPLQCLRKPDPAL